MQNRATQMRFPIGGVVKRMSYQQQAPFTTPSAKNVWPDDNSEDRERGGERPGLGKFYSNTTSAQIQLIADVTYVNSGAWAKKAVVVSGGTLYYGSLTSGTTLTSVSGVTFNSSFKLGHADLLQKLYILSDNNANYRPIIFNPATNGLSVLTATAGTIPTKCTLMTNWNNRLVMAGSLTDPQNWYMSKLGDPTDWDVANTTSIAAVAGNNSDQGRLGQPIRALIRHTHECLIMGCDSSLWVLQGDPAGGGRLMPLSQTVGVHSSHSFCYDPNGTLYFLGNDGIYMMAPGCGSAPVSLSRERLPASLINLARDSYDVSMSYDMRFRGIHLFIRAKSGSDHQHWFIDTRLAVSGDQGGAGVSFWPISFASSDHNPTCTYEISDIISGNGTSSNVFMGCADGYIRHYQRSASNDDGTAIDSYVDYGPFPLSQPGREGLFQEVQVTLGEGSSRVQLEVRAGKSAEATSDAKSLAYQQLRRAGLNPKVYPRLRGNAGMFRLQSTGGKWSVDDVTIKRLDAGERRV
jgi:hypothetical protein